MFGVEWKKGLASMATLLVVMGVTVPVVQAQEEEQAAQPVGLNLSSIFELPENFGWLSDPEEKANDIVEAIAGGKVSVNNRLRIETVDQGARHDALAFTNRVRFGYTTKAYNGISFMVEGENLAALINDYYVPHVPQGSAARSVVADPRGTELNQAYGRYEFKRDNLVADFKGGRQRISLDDQRFIGPVGWRQREQTMDAVSIKSTLGIDNLDVFYAYVWYVQGIFGPQGHSAAANGNPLESNSHLINASYTVRPELKLTGFIYLLDFNNRAIQSSNTYGIRATGKVSLEEIIGEAWSSAYELTYAHQTDGGSNGGSNAISYEANFFAVDVKLVHKEYGFAGLGYQSLGSDNGVIGFQMPLGTNHAFNGWADIFLGTPAGGLEDAYVYIGTTLPCKTKGKLVFHKFYSSRGNSDLGWEFDAVVSKKLSRNWSVLSKFAYYQNNGSATLDTTKFILETTFSF